MIAGIVLVLLKVVICSGFCNFRTSSLCSKLTKKDPYITKEQNEILMLRIPLNLQADTNSLPTTPFPLPSASDIPEKIELPSVTLDDITLVTLSFSPTETIPFPENSLVIGYVIDDFVRVWQQKYEEQVISFRNAPRFPGSTPTLFEYLRTIDFHSEDLTDHLRYLYSVNTKNFEEVFEKYQQVFTRSVEEGKNLQKSVIEQLQEAPMESLSQSFHSFISNLLNQGFSNESIEASLRSLNTDGLGGWYTGALSLALLVAVYVSNLSVRESYESKSNEAAVSLDKTDEESNIREQSLLSEKDIIKTRLTGLSQATVEVSKKLKRIKEEKVSKDYEIAQMKSELRSLKLELKNQLLKGSQLASSLLNAEKLLRFEKERLKKASADRYSAEKYLLDQISYLQAKLGNLTIADELELKFEIDLPIATKTKKKYPKPKKIHETSEQVLEPSQQPEPQGVFFSSVEAPTLPASEKELPFALPKKKSKKTILKTKILAEESSQLLDWSNLSSSAIKRKTQGELISFLEEKGETGYGSDGKAMRKAELIEKILKIITIKNSMK